MVIVRLRALSASVSWMKVRTSEYSIVLALGDSTMTADGPIVNTPVCFQRSGANPLFNAGKELHGLNF